MKQLHQKCLMLLRLSKYLIIWLLEYLRFYFEYSNHEPFKFLTWSFTLSTWSIGSLGRVFTNGPGNLGSIPGRVIPKTLEMVLDTSLLNTQQYKVRIIRVKWSNPRKGVASSPTPRCSSYWKGSLLVALDYGRQLYFYLDNHETEKWKNLAQWF